MAGLVPAISVSRAADAGAWHLTRKAAPSAPDLGRQTGPLAPTDLTVDVPGKAA